MGLFDRNIPDRQEDRTWCVMLIVKKHRTELLKIRYEEIYDTTMVMLQFIYSSGYNYDTTQKGHADKEEF